MQINYNMCLSVPLKLLNGHYKKKQHMFIQAAIDKAHQSPMNHKHGAVIVYRGKIIASGYNYLQQHKTYSHSIHAEVAAIKDLLNNKEYRKIPHYKCELYVVRIGKESMGFPTKMSKPCGNCYKSCKKVGMKTIYWTTDDEFNISSSDNSSDDEY